MKYYIYIIYSLHFDKYYIGQSSDVENRLNQHNRGISKSTKPYKPWVLKLKVEKSSRKEAIILETKLKNLSKIRLKKFIEKYS